MLFCDIFSCVDILWIIPICESEIPESKATSSVVGLRSDELVEKVEQFLKWCHIVLSFWDQSLCRSEQ